MAFASIPTSPTKGIASRDPSTLRELLPSQDQPRSRAAETAPAIRRLLFPADTETSERPNHDICGKVMTSTSCLENNFTIHEVVASQVGSDSNFDNNLGRDAPKRGFDFKLKKVFAYDDYLNSTQAWTASCATALLSLHARAQLRVNEFKDMRTVKALVEDLPKFARRVAPSTPTRFVAQPQSFLGVYFNETIFSIYYLDSRSF